MPESERWVVVLWGAWFEEAVASIFITELRRAGLPVKLVGLRHYPVAGQHGLRLVPDWSLEQALERADEVLALIVPCDKRGLQPLRRDPRLAVFIEQALRHRLRVLVAHLDLSATSLLPAQVACTLYWYPDIPDLVDFVRMLALRLQEEL